MVTREEEVKALETLRRAITTVTSPDYVQAVMTLAAHIAELETLAADAYQFGGAVLLGEEKCIVVPGWPEDAIVGLMDRLAAALTIKEGE